MSGITFQSKIERICAVVLDLLREHKTWIDGLPTTIRFLFYELEQRGLATKPDREGPRKGMRRSIGWPPGSQDITDAVTRLREDGSIPWDWIADTERTLFVPNYWPDMATFKDDALASFRLNPWEPFEPPLILTEAKGNAQVLERVAALYRCPIAGVKGFTAGFLRTQIAPLLEDTRRDVLYLGDYDRSGFDIENSVRNTLEDAIGQLIPWQRIALTETQIRDKQIEPIWKVDKRDEQGHEAWECEALGQEGVVSVVRETLASRLLRQDESIEAVQERERQLTEEERRK